MTVRQMLHELAIYQDLDAEIVVEVFDGSTKTIGGVLLQPDKGKMVIVPDFTLRAKP